jgi:hypothetical protein
LEVRGYIFHVQNNALIFCKKDYQEEISAQTLEMERETFNLPKYPVLPLTAVSNSGQSIRAIIPE